MILATYYYNWATSWENLFLPCANNKGTDQPAHLCSLISIFVIHCPDSIIPPFSISKISSLQLVTVAAQAGLSLSSSRTPKTCFLMTSSYKVCWIFPFKKYDTSPYGSYCGSKCLINLEHVISKQAMTFLTKWATAWQNDCVPSKDSDQPGHLPSLIRVFAVCSVGS